MAKKDKYPNPDQVMLTGRLSEFRAALQEEIKEIENNGQNSTLLHGGHGIEAKGEGFWYRFFVDYMPILPADTPCKLTVGTDQYDVTVISSNENEIILSSKSKLPANIGKAKLENGSTVLMERLIKCIEENAEKNNPAGERMFSESGDRVYQVKHLLSYDEIHYAKHSNDKQKDAVKSALENDITYIWGPPGTGKTTVIGNIIDELYQHERTVLIVSHTNTAVDGAIAKVEKEYRYTEACKEENKPYPMLRIGIPSEDIPKSALLESHVEQLGKELVEKKEALEKHKLEILHELEQIVIILEKDSWLKNSKLHAIQVISNVVNELGKKKLQLEEKVDKEKAELDKIIQAHPEVQLLVQLQNEYEKKKNEIQKIKDEIASINIKKEQCKRNRQTAEDEIKKHFIYDELTMKIRRYMSVPFYKAKIQEAESAIESIKNKLKSLTEQKAALQDAINKYESKGAVAKFFAGTSTYEQNLNSLSAKNTSIDSEMETLHQKENLLADYQKQLKELQLLLEKHRDVAPSRTRRYWTEEEQRFKNLLNELNTESSSLEKQKNNLFSRITEIEMIKRKNQGFYDSMETIQQRIDTYQQNLTEINIKYSQNQEELTKLFEKEYKLCECFYSVKNVDKQEQINELLSLNKRINEELRSVDIEEEKKRKESCENEVNEIFAELSDIQKKMAELEKQVIMNARIVGTTLAKSYLSDVLRERQFDTVILDEASMASIPALWCAAYLAEKNIVIVGDFLQLPPIVMADTEMAKKWLGRDIFDHSGMKEMAKKINRNNRPTNFVMLYEQYRMEADIAAIANIYYGRKYTDLKSNDMNPARVKARDMFYSWYSGNKTKDHIHLIDTESLHAWVTGIPQAKGHSRLNTFSAAVDVALAFKCLDKFVADKLYEKDEHKGTKVLIVAPYKPHVTLLNKLIENECLQRGINPELNLVKAGTIHSFQGSEADIVIFDLVVDEPHWKANLFISDPERNDALEKMFNVAVTRAKFKLYVVADFKYCQSRAKDNPLSVLLDYLTERYIKVDAKKQLLPKMVIPQSNQIILAGAADTESIFVTESTFHDYFLLDIQSFNHNMIIYSPFMTENRISMLLPVFYTAVAKGKRIAVITKPLSERPKSELAQYKKCEKGLRDIGVSILHKKGMHEKTILIDNDVIWNGSLNALSYTGNTGELMERRKDNSKEKTIINSFIKILDIDYLVKALENTYETKCPICGGEMLIAESEDGGIYWKCINEDYSRNKEQQYPVDGVLRCSKCNSPFVFSMKNKPRWVCTADSKHYQYLRKNDLKLPQMAALLSHADKKRVMEYFGII